jgi:hypothetical protein
MATARAHGIEHPVHMTLGFSDGEQVPFSPQVPAAAG